MTAEPRDRPIGFVSYAEGQVLAELIGHDRWRVTVAGKDAPDLARSLAALYRDTYAGPSDGYYGQAILRDLAERIGGVASFDQPRPAAFGEIP